MEYKNSKEKVESRMNISLASVPLSFISNVGKSVTIDQDYKDYAGLLVNQNTQLGNYVA